MTRRGFTVLDAEDGAAALALFKREKDRVDVLVTDVVMPNMNGADLAKQAEQLKPGLKILFISGHPERAGAGLDPTGVTNLLMKPFTADTLAALDPGPPQVANGIALLLAGLGDSHAAADTIGGKSILEFLNGQTQIIGQQAADATESQTVAQQSVAQARAIRTQVSGVSLDEEAVRIIQSAPPWNPGKQRGKAVKQRYTLPIFFKLG